MKRSKSIRLVVVASTAVALAGCSGEPQSDGKVYTSEQDCVVQKHLTDAECKQIIDEGKNIHLTSGPRYDSYDLCRNEHGRDNCNSVDGARVYAPSPAGYFLAAAPLSSLLTSRVRPVYPGKKKRTYYTSGGYFVSYHGGNQWRTADKAIASTPKPAKVQTRTTVASRKGFGGRSGGGFGG